MTSAVGMTSATCISRWSRTKSRARRSWRAVARPLAGRRRAGGDIRRREGDRASAHDGADRVPGRRCHGGGSPGPRHRRARRRERRRHRLAVPGQPGPLARPFGLVLSDGDETRAFVIPADAAGHAAALPGMALPSAVRDRTRAMAGRRPRRNLELPRHGGPLHHLVNAAGFLDPPVGVVSVGSRGPAMSTTSVSFRPQRPQRAGQGP